MVPDLERMLNKQAMYPLRSGFSPKRVISSAQANLAVCLSLVRLE